MSIIAKPKAPEWGKTSKPGRLVKHNQWLQIIALTLGTGVIPASFTKRYSGVSVHSRTISTVCERTESVESVQPSVAEILEPLNQRKFPSQHAVEERP